MITITKDPTMDQNMKKMALRMIPYGLYVLTAETSDGRVGAATINWVTQASFDPPLIVACVKADSNIHNVIRNTLAFALNVLDKSQQAVAYKFFKPADKDDTTISGERYTTGKTGSPILNLAPAFLECKVIHSFEKGDHTVFVGEVVEAEVRKALAKRPDESTLWLKDLGENVFYGG